MLSIGLFHGFNLFACISLASLAYTNHENFRFKGLPNAWMMMKHINLCIRCFYFKYFGCSWRVLFEIIYSHPFFGNVTWACSRRCLVFSLGSFEANRIGSGKEQNFWFFFFFLLLLLATGMELHPHWDRWWGKTNQKKVEWIWMLLL